MTGVDQGTVLHVDDDESFLQLTSDFFERHGFEFEMVQCSDPSRVMDLLEEEDIDCVLSDYSMEGMDGVDLLKDVRDRYPDIPFVILTSMGSEEVASRAINHGVDDYIRKKASTEQFNLIGRRLENAMSRQRTLDVRRKVLNRVTDAFFGLDDEWRFTYLNDRAEELLQRDREELVGKNLWEEFSAAKGTKFEEKYREAMEEQESVRFQEYYEPLGLWFRVHAFPSETGMSVYFRDFTDRRTREEKLDRRVRQQEVVREIGQLALETKDLDRLFSESCRKIRETLDTDYCKVLDLEEDEFVLRAGCGWEEKHIDSLTMGIERESQAGYALMSERPVVVEDMEEDDRFSNAEALEEKGVKSGVSTIIGTEEEPWGVLETHDEDRRNFSEHDVDFVQSVANVLAGAIRRKRQEQGLENMQLLEHVFETSPVTLAMVGPDGEVIRTNSHAEERLGIEPGTDYRVFDHRLFDSRGEEIPADERPYRKVFETGEPVFDYECQIELEDGERRWVSINAAPVTDESGEVARVVISSDDITEIKEQEKELKRERDDLQAELNEMFDRIDEAFISIDSEERLAYANDRARELFGLENKDIGDEIWSIMPLFEESEFRDAFEDATSDQEELAFQEYHSGIDSWLRVHLYPSETGVSVYFDDVTEQVERERELELYKKFLESSMDILSIVREDGTIEYISPMKDSLGYEQEELVGENAFEYIHPNDLEELKKLFRESMAEGSSSSTEHRFRKKDGSWLWLESFGSKRPDDDRIEGFLVDSRDITDRKKQDLTEHILEASPVGLLVLDDDGDIMASNSRANYLLRMEGDIPDAEPFEKVILEDEDGEKIPREHYPAIRALESGEPYYNFEARIRETDRWITVNAVPVDSTGSRTVVVSVEDITERKEIERSQGERLERFSKIVSHDLRNPLNVASGYLDLARESGKEEDFERVETALDNIEAVIDELSLITMDQEDLEKQVVSLEETFRESVDFIGADAVTYEVDDAEFEAGRPGLMRLFGNLVSNSVSHNEGDIHVEVRMKEDGFYYEDDGKGIPPAERKKVFDYGYTTGEGDGLGLSIVERIAELNGWSVKITEGSEGGARFEFEFNS